MDPDRNPPPAIPPALTAHDEQWPTRPLTVGEYLALGETELRTELHEGWLTVSPSQLLRHNKASRRLANALEEAVVPRYEVYNDTDVDLRLVAPDEPGFVPRPDVVVAQADAALRLEEEGGVLREVTGTFRTTEPFPFELDLSRLTDRRG